MAITLELTPELENQIRDNSSRTGLTLDGFILESIKAYLARFEKPKTENKTSPKHFSKVEADLLLKINQSLTGVDWTRYRHLIARRQAETITSAELDELIQISGELEDKNVKRITYVAELAQMRNSTLPSIMEELGLEPVSVD